MRFRPLPMAGVVLVCAGWSLAAAAEPVKRGGGPAVAQGAGGSTSAKAGINSGVKSNVKPLKPVASIGVAKRASAGQGGVTAAAKAPGKPAATKAAAQGLKAGTAAAEAPARPSVPSASSKGAAAVAGATAVGAAAVAGASANDAGGAALQESVGLSAQRLTRIGEVFQHEVRSGKLPGAVVMIARRGKVAYQQGWGYLDPATRTPMPADAVFRMYGLGEPIVAVAALMLVEDGLLQLTDPIEKYLPAFAGTRVITDKGEASASVQPSVHDLLRQTSGVGYAVSARQPRVKKALEDLGLEDPLKAAHHVRAMKSEEFVARIARVPLLREPGTAWEVGYAGDVLGRVVEAAAGKPLGQFLKERLFDPLEMSGATFQVAGSARQRIAQPVGGTSLVDLTVVPGNEAATSGLAMTSADYMRFAQMLLNGGILNGKRVLSPSTVRLMTSDHLGRDVSFDGADPGQYLMGTRGYTFGLGVAVRKDDGIASVPGSAGAFAWGSEAGSFFFVDPKEQLVVVYQAQAPNRDLKHYRRLVKQLVYQAILN